MKEKVLKSYKVNTIVDDMLIAKYEGQLPDDIISIWKEYGFGEFMDGYFKVINPDDYLDVLEMSYYASDRAIPIMVTAFGDVLVWEDSKYIMMIKYNVGDLKCIASKIPIFWRNMLDRTFLEAYFEFEQYNKAVSKLGELAFDECFGYTPLLGLGGSKKVDNLEKVKIREHIEIITTLVGRIE